MNNKVKILALALPLTFSSAFAKQAVIPKEQVLLHSFTANESVYVLKDAKGNLLQPSLFGAPDNWFNLSPADGSEGVRSEEAYTLFGDPEAEEIIVAVVDSGVDVNHEDLQGQIWINKGEIPDNGIDDDKNGYTDDVFGWNFIGGPDGMATIVEDTALENGLRLKKGNPAAQVGGDNLEVTRELARMKKLKATLEDLGESMSDAQTAYLDTLSKEVSEAQAEAQTVVATYTERLALYRSSAEILKAAGVVAITLENVRAVESVDPVVVQAKADMIKLLSNNLTEARLNRVLAAYGNRLKFHYNESLNTRDIVKDNYGNVKEKIYGNNDVIGPDSGHGTHVSGIIAARRDNSIGMKGVATRVKIMAVRVVPDGDERDKDVANGIRYAVDNGAKIINMSFGKAYSPKKSVVDEAMRYAESKGVLLLHAAGNDSKNNDILPSYPSRSDKAGIEFKNWLEIGASSFQKGPSLPAVFSNFGKKTVDIFAPGVDINSTIPDNEYGLKSGTSMATPAAAGVAALILAHDSSLDAEALKALILDTGRRYPKLQVKIPGTETLTLFSNLSTIGAITDVVEAVKVLKK